MRSKQDVLDRLGMASSPRVAGRRSLEAAVFNTISSEDWRRAIARARLEENAVRRKIEDAKRRAGL